MPPKFTPEKKDDNSYITHGLSDKQFSKVFALVQKAQNKARRNAKRTLTADAMRRKTSKQIKALGEKSKGVGFTKADLIAFDKQRKRHKEKYSSNIAGITYAQIIAGSRKIDIDRANNKVDDGTGITKATFIAVKQNVAIVRVRASMVSKHDEHRVEVRFEEWNDLLQDPPGGDFVKAAKAAAKGRISFDCKCGRHQYWYRYLATMGNYAVTPPAEFAFPKIKNAELKGVACKHVLLAVEMFQSIAWHRQLAKRMETQSRLVGFGDDKRQTTSYLTESDQKAAAKNRRTNIDQEKATKAFKAYDRSQKAMEKKIKNMSRDRELIKRQAKKVRTQAKQIQGLTGMIKANFNVFADGYKAQGKTKAQALKDYASNMNVTEHYLKDLVK